MRWGTLFLGFGAASALWAADPNEIEAVVAAPHNGYKRVQLQDGSYRAETYTFEQGEIWSGEISDPSIDKLTLPGISKVIAGPLAGENYLPARNASSAQLRIVVSWGTTTAPEYRSISMVNEALEDIENRGHGPGSVMGSTQDSILTGNANGFNSGANSNAGFQTVANSDSLGTGHSASGGTDAIIQGSRLAGAELAMKGQNDAWIGVAARNAGMLGYDNPRDPDLLHFRYFVVLQAYDNHPAPGKKGHLLWAARISVSEHHDWFDSQLAAMVLGASPFFGQSSGGLVHQRLPEGHVEIGEVRSLDDVAAPPTAALAPDGVHVAYLRDSRYGRRLIIVDLDHPGHLVFGDVPNQGALPMDFAWSDSSHVEITLSTNSAFTFDSAGHRSDAWIAPARVRAVVNPVEITAAATARFPHRTVSVRGWDQTGQRFLLEVAGGAAGLRYYIYDRPTDLLIDLGRTTPPS